MEAESQLTWETLGSQWATLEKQINGPVIFLVKVNVKFHKKCKEIAYEILLTNDIQCMTAHEIHMKFQVNFSGNNCGKFHMNEPSALNPP